MPVLGHAPEPGRNSLHSRQVHVSQRVRPHSGTRRPHSLRSTNRSRVRGRQEGAGASGARRAALRAGSAVGGGRCSREDGERDRFEDVPRDPAASNPTCASSWHCEGSAVAERGARHLLSKGYETFPNPFPITKADSWMRKAPFLSSPTRVTVSKPFMHLEKVPPAEQLPREQDAQVMHSAPFHPHGLQTGSQITSGAGDRERAAAPRRSPHGSPHNTNGFKLAGADMAPVNNPENPHSLPPSTFINTCHEEVRYYRFAQDLKRHSFIPSPPRDRGRGGSGRDGSHIKHSLFIPISKI